MLVRTVRQPGQPGTRRYQRKYGERLVCVRYRVVMCIKDTLG